MPGARLDGQDSIHIWRRGRGEWRHGCYGKIDGVTVWSRALSEAEVPGLWTAWTRSVE